MRQLASIATDPGRKRKLRRRALNMWSGDKGRWRGDLSIPVFAALLTHIQIDELGFPVLFGLMRLETAPRIESLLAQFSESGDDAERVLAKRALDGEVVIHIDNF